jgi:hypothetical protein
MRATAEKPWDRLCDQLNGSGVPNLDDALVNLELRPVHTALRLQLDSAMVRSLADLAEHPRTIAGGKDKRIEQERKEFFEAAWARCESFLRLAQKAYASRTAHEPGMAKVQQPEEPATLAPVFRERLRAAMRIPAIEALFPAPWTAAARRVLPSPSPQFTATAMWGPLLGWCVLELLAESIDAENPEHVALDLFDRLRLREPFAQAFAALGFEGEEGWRVAARIKVVLLTGAGVGREKEPGVAVETSPPVADAPEDVYEATTAEAELAIPVSDPGPVSDKPQALEEERVAIAPDLWLDPDVRWLTGAHEAEGHAYLVRESYEELLWWMLMPSLLRLAGETAPSRAVVEQMSKTVKEALETAEAAGYRIDALLGTVEGADSEAVIDLKAESESIEPDLSQNHAPEPSRDVGHQEPKLEPETTSAAKPADSVQS